MMNMIIALMDSWLYTYPQIHQAVHTIYTVFMWQSYCNEVVKKISVPVSLNKIAKLTTNIYSSYKTC